jgi:hypothetical protein
MQRVEKIVNRLHRDLNPEKVNIQYTESGERVKLLKGDSCLSMDKNGDLTVRISSTNKKSAMAILSFLLQLTGVGGGKYMVQVVQDFEEDVLEEDDEEELGQKLSKMLMDKLSKNDQQIDYMEQDIEEAILDLHGGKDKIKSIINAMYVPKGEFTEDMFDELPTISDIRNIKIIIEE